MTEKRLSLYEYPTSLSSPKIEPIDIGVFQKNGVTKANNFFNGKWNDLLQEAESLKQSIELNERVYRCKYSFEPIVGQVYHLYRNNLGDEFLSIISPSEWKMEHLISVKLNSDLVWKKIS